MARLLLSLRDVPDDEADDVRALLDALPVAYYETRPSRFGISAGGIWLADDADETRAREALAGYQARRREAARADYAQALRDGTAVGFFTFLRRHPLRVLVTLVAIVLLVGLLLLPSLLIGR
ncbi:DUF6164 family protein [Tahibacter amnicola]|uniref:DUF6164 family protein n=1 Tax=Tahibacter amnicola TaxID=2976241 RepID=A0ABY6BHA4_9GAMM|nr:DUF6164 family protein [Tahibacter amnicola]UXI67242.1 DUF6164 family protein [Tahibacter amnicola]